MNFLMKGEFCCIICFRVWFFLVDVGFVEFCIKKIKVVRYVYMYNVGWYELWKGWMFIAIYGENNVFKLIKY